METKFNSEICTSRIQSERLLSLGLKKETADMCWQTTTLNGEPITYPSQDVWFSGSIITNNHFPAWSLHRLWELGQFMGINLSAKEHIARLYDFAIDHIEKEIKEGYFNKAYLEE